MILTELKIHNLRNVLNLQLKLNQQFNFIVGPNGSGKTTVLEALYLLSCGHSFRSREISPIITYDQSMLTLFARGVNEESLSIQKSHKQPTQIKVNNQFCFKTSQLAYTLPSQIFYSDIFQIIEAGPSVRRGLLDWGLFHVKHEYLALWKSYRRILKQRNALLKTQASYSQFLPWDLQMSQLAQDLHALRVDYFVLWQQAFDKVIEQLTDVRCSLSYIKGWDKKDTGKSLKECLEETFVSDKLKLYTQQGAHQADVLIENNETKAKQSLSRGQQKIILISMKLAQSTLLEKQCLYLFDDLTAELDETHQKKLLNYLSNHTGQYLITSTHPIPMMRDLQPDQYSVFLMDKGNLTVLSHNFF